MNEIILNRVFQNQNKTLSVGGVFNKAFLNLEFKTIELPWRENTRFISCIPEGIYIGRAINRWSNGAYAIHILDVPGRSEILFHIANFVRQLEGCVAPGMRIRDIDNDGILDVEKSGVAMRLLEQFFPVGSPDFKITITDIFKIRGNADISKLDRRFKVRDYSKTRKI